MRDFARKIVRREYNGMRDWGRGRMRWVGEERRTFFRHCGWVFEEIVGWDCEYGVLD